jgi:hypothetical protein
LLSLVASCLTGVEFENPLSVLRLGAGDSQRLELPFSGGKSDQAQPVTDITVDCTCLRILSGPEAIPTTGKAKPVVLQARGGLPGIKTLTVSGDGWSAVHTIQVITPDGAGTGRGVLAWALKEAQRKKLDLLVIAHDLKDGDPSACPCGIDGLGGLERLAVLAADVASHPASARSRLLITGTWSRHNPAITQLFTRGWREQDERVIVSERPGVALVKHPTSLVIPRKPTRIQDERLVVPVLTAGTGVELILLDGNKIDGRWLLPVDESFDTIRK